MVRLIYSGSEKFPRMFFTSEAPHSRDSLCFCYLHIDPSLPCRVLYPKSWSKLHFNRSTLFYYTNLNSIPPSEVTMKEEMRSWFQRLGYEDEFGPGKVPPTKVRKNRIYAYALLSAVNFEERGKYLVKMESPCFSYMPNCIFQIICIK